MYGVRQGQLTSAHVKLSNKDEIGSRMNSTHAGHHDLNLQCVHMCALHTVANKREWLETVFKQEIKMFFLNPFLYVQFNILPLSFHPHCVWT